MEWTHVLVTVLMMRKDIVIKATSGRKNLIGGLFTVSESESITMAAGRQAGLREREREASTGTEMNELL